MAEVLLPDTNAVVEVIPAGNLKSVIHCINGTALLENAADPFSGIPLKAGESIQLGTWTAPWAGRSGNVGQAVLLRVATEAAV